PILAITNVEITARQLNLVWGVHPFLIKDLKFDEWCSEEIMQKGIKALVEYGILELKEHVICTIPSRISPDRCSIMGLYYVEDILRDIKIENQEYNPDFK
ncbi:MAG: pyruvate kinase alpha/beta domain-containing protein, partial [Promethearchaeota archaeon]